MNFLSLINLWLDINYQITTKCATLPKLFHQLNTPLPVLKQMILFWNMFGVVRNLAKCWVVPGRVGALRCTAPMQVWHWHEHDLSDHLSSTPAGCISTRISLERWWPVTTASTRLCPANPRSPLGLDIKPARLVMARLVIARLVNILARLGSLY